MALALAQFPIPQTPKPHHSSTPPARRTTATAITIPKWRSSLSRFSTRHRNFVLIPKSSPEEEKTATDASEEDSSNPNRSELPESGPEIGRAEAARTDGADLLSGVAEEVQEIEWPAFGKVLGTTGVVLGVIAGSSVVLLTVNAVLAEISDKIFAGRGVQDFFG